MSNNFIFKKSKIPMKLSSDKTSQGDKNITFLLTNPGSVITTYISPENDTYTRHQSTGSRSPKSSATSNSSGATITPISIKIN